jgi:hypothetical protein
MKILKWIKTIMYSIFFRIGLALNNVAEEFQTDNFELDPNKKIVIKKRNQNPLLKKFEIGERDERYTKDYYEVLKKADKFLKHATSEQIQVAADKYGMSYGKKDRWGRRFEHYGFYDPKSKHYGKTLAEAIEDQVSERKTKDDDYPVVFMINNSKPLDGFTTMKDIVSKDDSYELKNELERVIEKRFKINVIRDKNTVNKIEQLTEFLHIKQISSIHRQYEFFINKKYRLHNYDENTDIFKEIVDIQQIWFKDEWGQMHFFAVDKFLKRIDFDDNYEVLKFTGRIVEKL